MHLSRQVCLIKLPVSTHVDPCRLTEKEFFLNLEISYENQGTAFPTRSRSYDFRIYNYNAGVVVGYIESLFNWKKILLLSKHAKLLVAL
jgi:hypothetical protein